MHCLTSKFHVKFHAKTRLRMGWKTMSAILVFQLKFNLEFTRPGVNFS